MQAMHCCGCEAPQGQQRSLPLLDCISRIIPILQATLDSLVHLTHLTVSKLQLHRYRMDGLAGRRLFLTDTPANFGAEARCMP